MEWQRYFEELAATGRAHTLERGGKTFWVATERRHLSADPVATVRGWMESIGPITAASLARDAGISTG